MPDERPRWETARGAPGALADLMSGLSHEIFETPWLGGLEHHLWSLYLRSQDGPQPTPGSTGARLRAFGALVTALGGLWTWPMDGEGPTWTHLDRFLERHRAWAARQSRRTTS